MATRSTNQWTVVVLHHWSVTTSRTCIHTWHCAKIMYNELCLISDCDHSNCANMSTGTAPTVPTCQIESIHVLRYCMLIITCIAGHSENMIKNKCTIILYLETYKYHCMRISGSVLWYNYINIVHKIYCFLLHPIMDVPQ